ncbi:hypothetical protein ACFQZQ_10350 [Lysobacter koreensis]|uniref:Uncharacterized protein n=1 Tax=Lysobacter koreensis TaxID=266122 RepID=A0ABW2YNR9_9GAMM
MPWLYLLLALAALAVAFKTTSVALLVVCLLVAFALMLAWVMALLASRVDSSSRSEAMMLDPAEMQRLREQAEARRLAAASPAQGEPQR